MKKYEIHIDINKAMSICIRAGVKIYPVISRSNMFKVEMNDNGKIRTFDKEFNGNSVANAVHKTYKWYAKKLKQKQDAKKS